MAKRIRGQAFAPGWFFFPWFKITGLEQNAVSK
jgi:hypothetical protein